MKTLGIILLALAGVWVLFSVIVGIKRNIKFKKTSQYPCFKVMSQDGFLSEAMYYKDAKVHSDKIYGFVYVDDVIYKEFKDGKKNCKVLN